jgi:tetratricopeptide (TPR) repeat protein
MDENLRSKMILGREHYRAGEYQKAEPYLSEVVKVHQSFPDLFNMLGVIYSDMDRLDEAESAFETALELNPNYTEAALNLAVTYNERGKFDKARRVYNDAMSRSRRGAAPLDPFAKGKLANMHADLGGVYASAAMYEDAAREFERALELCPHFVDIRTRLGHVYRDMGKPKAAIEQYDRALRDKHDYVVALLALGVTHFSIGNRDAAITAWRQVLKCDPNDKKAAAYLRMIESDRPPQSGTQSP